MPTLLYVDDEEAIGRAVGRWFERRGYRVLLALDIAGAQRLLETSEPDALVIDIWLGIESGFELLSWIEAQRPHLVPRVTLVTGELADVHRDSSLWTTRGRPVVQKPFELTHLLRVVEEAAPSAV
ncbi:MAG: response regulator [Gemmatimonadaceae bacterium]|nr:response regulator [Gemmatimonadaceae bacterium]